MKKSVSITILLTVISLSQAIAQSELPSPGIHVSNGIAYVSKVSSNIGYFTQATGLYSFAGGNQSQATGDYSFAFGNNAYANADNSYSLGSFIQTSQSPSIIIGSGYGSHYPMTASKQGITMGMGSTLPTVFISMASGERNTGKVAIGDVTPTAKLHIRSDEEEDAGIIVEPGDPTSNETFIRLKDNQHYINVDPNGVMNVSAGNNSALGISSSNFKIDGNLVRLGVNGDEKFTLSTDYTPSIGLNAQPSSNGYMRGAHEYPSYVLEFSNNALRLKTASYMIPRSDLITNWTDALTVKPNGAITFDGRVGVNIENTYPGYALAVDGGILTTKVHIQEVGQWQDCVFGDDYRLMPLGEVEAYVAANRHLPGVPSEAEVKADGYDVAEMQAVLLGKIEELTLHVIRQQKEIDSLRTLVTVRFGYDACGNRVSRTLEFSRMELDALAGGTPSEQPDQWQASLSDRFEGAETSLFPNPTEGGFILSIGGELPKDAKAILCTLDGKVLEERGVSSATEAFDLGGMPAGVYLLRLTSERETKVWKVIKRN